MIIWILRHSFWNESYSLIIMANKNVKPVFAKWPHFGTNRIWNKTEPRSQDLWWKIKLKSIQNKIYKDVSSNNVCPMFENVKQKQIIGTNIATKKYGLSSNLFVKKNKTNILRLKPYLLCAVYKISASIGLRFFHRSWKRIIVFFYKSKHSRL